MGLCFSKKKRAPCDTPRSEPNSNGKKSEEKEKKKDSRKQTAVALKKGTEPPVAEKKPVFVVTQNAKTAEEKEKKKVEVPTKKPEVKQEAETISAGKAPSAEEIRTVQVPVRTSSCTKEEVDAILIQCGRLSRSSSGKNSNETGGAAHRRYSGSKRSFDFDHERRGDEEDDERPVSRPSPHRRTPGRDRSGSRERGGSGGSRRVSRSPGRRSDGPASTTSANEKSKPTKMVSVPAREKPAEAGSLKKSSNSGTVPAKRNASPRSRSPASNSLNRSVGGGGGNENGVSGAQPSLSRSSSRKAESPYRRNPMAEIDENSMRGNQNGSASFKSQKGNTAQSQVRSNL